LSTRINQEPLLIATPGLTAGNVRINQAALLLLVPASLVGSKVQIVGGPFQDALGNALSNGYLVFQLQHDAVALNVGQIMGNVSVRVPLDINGYIQGTVSGAPIYMWPNNILLPAGGTYLIWAYDSSNRLAWDNPQVQSVLSSPSPFNVDAWIPGP
jgi:hypothetical protein